MIRMIHSLAVAFSDGLIPVFCPQNTIYPLCISNFSSFILILYIINGHSARWPWWSNRKPDRKFKQTTDYGGVAYGAAIENRVLGDAFSASFSFYKAPAEATASRAFYQQSPSGEYVVFLCLTGPAGFFCKRVQIREKIRTPSPDAGERSGNTG